MAALTLDQAMHYALQRHQAGFSTEAEAICRQILAQQPNCVDALYLLGEVAREHGQLETASALIQRAISLRANDAKLYNALALVLDGQKQWAAAADACRTALSLNPQFAEAHNNLGNFLRLLGDIDGSVAAFHNALKLQPESASTYNNLAIALKTQGRSEEAIAALRNAATLQPDFFGAHFNLGIMLAQNGDRDAAVTALQSAIRLRPDFPQALRVLGELLTGLGRLPEGISTLHRLTQLCPSDAAAFNALGYWLSEFGQPIEAAAACQRSIQLQPDYALAHNNLGRVLQSQNAFEAAIECFQTALQFQPDNFLARNNLGLALKEWGELDEAIAHLRAAVELAPDNAIVHSNLVYTLHFHAGSDARGIAAEAARWQQRHAASLPVTPPQATRDRNPARRLRIGYVSPNFWEQAECYFVAPLLEAHDRKHVELYCYASVLRPDDMTERLRRCADVWCDALGLSDDALAARICADEIDILVDLTMHMSRNRLLVFARKPAPIQVTWLAYPGTTGLSRIDYRFTDGWMEPDGLETCLSAEERVRLPDSWCCYRPVTSFPEVAPPPALTAGHITFGSLNNFRKVNARVLDRWARLLQAVNDSTLLILAPEGKPRQRVREALAQRDIDPQRVDFVSECRRQEYLRHYDRIDIGLDPFPYNGITTTCDALWMGVPVLTLPGEIAACRAGLSLLSAAGLSEFVAESEEDYVARAAALAHDPEHLAELRMGLRERLSRSPLMDAPRFARNVEAAYRVMWQHWCAPPTSPTASNPHP
jgi:predicted O-linked N-acetylglucosamine transferase (SPINDLY family)